MRLENDKEFNFLFEEEYKKIPWIFRWSQKRFIGALIFMGVCFVAAMIFLALFNDSAEYVTMPSFGGYEMGFNDYNYAFLIAMIICFAVIAVMAAWMVLSKLLENRAFKKATELNNMIFLTERHRVEMEWQKWKMENRDY